MLKFTNNSTLKRLSDNFISLLTLQFINYILPLVLIPYLIQALGMEGFGIYAFIFAIATYGVKVSDYGFDLSATYHVSIHKKNQNKINEIFSCVLFIKFALALIFLFVLSLSIFSFEKLYMYKEMLFLSYGMLLGNVFLPLWYFQGIEKMRFIMYLNGLLKLSLFLLIILFIKEPNDLALLMTLHSITTIIIGALGLYMAVKYFDVRLIPINKTQVFFYLKDGWYIFTSKIAVEFYSSTSTIIAGFFVSPLILGYYAISIKIMAALGNLFDPIIRVVYPYLVGVYQSSNQTFVTRNKQLSVVILLVMVPMALLLYFFAKDILELITGQEVETLSLYLLKVSSLILIVFPYGGQFTNMLVTIKETRILNNILFMAAIINLLLAPIMLHFFGIVGMIWLNVFIAYFLIITKAYYVHKKVNNSKETKK